MGNQKRITPRAFCHCEYLKGQSIRCRYSGEEGTLHDRPSIHRPPKTGIFLPQNTPLLLLQEEKSQSFYFCSNLLISILQREGLEPPRPPPGSVLLGRFFATSCPKIRKRKFVSHKDILGDRLTHLPTAIKGCGLPAFWTKLSATTQVFLFFSRRPAFS